MNPSDFPSARAPHSLFSSLILLFILAHCGHHLLTALPIPLLPMIRREMGLDYTQSGWVVSAFTLAYGIGQIPGGWFTDRVGPRWMITLGISGLGMAGLGVGFSHSFWGMVFFLALMGILGGGYHPAAPRLISASVDLQYQGRALGFHLIGGGASFFLAPLVAVGIASVWSWRGAFISLAVLAIAFGLFFHRTLARRETPKRNDFQKNGKMAEGGRSRTPRPLRPLVAFILLSNLLGATITASLAFIPLLLVDRLGYSQENAGALFAFIYSAGLWVSPLAGYLADRFGRVPLMIAVSVGSAPVIFLLNHASSFWAMVTLLILLGVVIYVRMPVSEAYILRQASERNRSLILGIYNFGSMEGGGLLTPLMGYLIDRIGFDGSYTVAGIFILVVTLVCGLFLKGSED